MWRRQARLLFTLPLVTTFAVACAETNDVDDAESSDEALRRIDVDPPPPPKPKPPPPKPDAGTKPPILPIHSGIETGVLAPSGPWCGNTRIDLRRITRTCEDLPGAFQQNGITYVPGTDGRFKVERTFASNASVPEDAKAKTCTFTWEPAKCGAQPDIAKLLVEQPNEQIVPRAPGCEYLLPNGCGIITPPPPYVPGVIPTGVGRCEVCGFAVSDHMWAILPSGWTSFSYVAGSQRRYVELASSQDVWDTGLAANVSAQNIAIYKGDAAPQ